MVFVYFFYGNRDGCDEILCLSNVHKECTQLLVFAASVDCSLTADESRHCCEVARKRNETSDGPWVEDESITLHKSFQR